MQHIIRTSNNNLLTVFFLLSSVVCAASEERWGPYDAWNPSTFMAFKAACEDRENVPNVQNSMPEICTYASQAVLEKINFDERDTQMRRQTLESNIKKEYGCTARKLYMHVAVGDEKAKDYQHGIDDIISRIRCENTRLRDMPVSFGEAYNALDGYPNCMPCNQHHNYVLTPVRSVCKSLDCIRANNRFIPLMKQLSDLLIEANNYITEGPFLEHMDLFFGNSRTCKDYQLGGGRPQAFRGVNPQDMQLCKSLREEDMVVSEEEFEMLIKHM